MQFDDFESQWRRRQESMREHPSNWSPRDEFDSFETTRILNEIDLEVELLVASYEY